MVVILNEDIGSYESCSFNRKKGNAKPNKNSFKGDFWDYINSGEYEIMETDVFAPHTRVFVENVGVRGLGVSRIRHEMPAEEMDARAVGRNSRVSPLREPVIAAVNVQCRGTIAAGEDGHVRHHGTRPKIDGRTIRAIYGAESLQGAVRHVDCHPGLINREKGECPVEFTSSPVDIERYVGCRLEKIAAAVRKAEAIEVERHASGNAQCPGNRAILQKPHTTALRTTCDRVGERCIVYWCGARRREHAGLGERLAFGWQANEIAAGKALHDGILADLNVSSGKVVPDIEAEATARDGELGRGRETVAARNPHHVHAAVDADGRDTK